MTYGNGNGNGKRELVTQNINGKLVTITYDEWLNLFLRKSHKWYIKKDRKGIRLRRRFKGA